MSRAHDVYDELTDIFSGDPPTEEMPTALFTSAEHVTRAEKTGPMSRAPSFRSLSASASATGHSLFPFSWDGPAEETIPVPATVLASSQLPSDEDAADLKAFVREAASRELRHRRPRRRS